MRNRILKNFRGSRNSRRKMRRRLSRLNIDNLRKMKIRRKRRHLKNNKTRRRRKKLNGSKKVEAKLIRGVNNLMRLNRKNRMKMFNNWKQYYSATGIPLNLI